MLIGKAGKLVKRIGSMPCFAAISLVAGSSGCLGSSATTSATDDGGETRMVDVTVPEVGRIPPDGAYAGLDSTTRDSDATVPDLPPRRKTPHLVPLDRWPMPRPRTQRRVARQASSV
jgi:hypothetical protein